MPPPSHLEQNGEHARAVAAIHATGREIAASLDLDRTLHVVMRKAAERGAAATGQYPVSIGVCDRFGGKAVAAVGGKPGAAVASRVTGGGWRGEPVETGVPEPDS